MMTALVSVESAPREKRHIFGGLSGEVLEGEDYIYTCVRLSFITF